MTEDAKAVEDEEEAPRKSSKGKATMIVYRGNAESFEHGKHVFRPGQPVEVPSDVAEDLLTYPNETFEEAE